MTKYIKFNVDNELVGRYDAAFHGSRTTEIPDPSFIWPQIEVQNYEYDHETSVDGPTIFENDPGVIPPTITVQNQDGKIPADAVEVSDELFHQTINETDGVWKRDPATGDIVKHPFPAPSLDEVKAAKSAEINAACAASIVGGFTSAALGAPHTYDSALEDQLNLIGAVSLGIDLPYRYADAAGIKEFRLHTSEQLKQVAADGALVKLTALEKAAALKAQVQSATDAAAVEAVAWLK